MAKLLPSQLEKIFSDFPTYCKYMIPKVDGRYEWSWFHEYIMQRIDFYIKQGYGRLIIEMAPQHGKTLIAGQLLPTYFLAKYPNKKILYATHTDARAEAVLTEGVYPLLFSDEYRSLFPHIQFKYDLDNQKNDIRTKKARKSMTMLSNRFNLVGYRGAMLAVGAGAGVSGYPSHLTIIDDYFGSYESAQSDIIRDKIIKWWRADIKMRAQPETLEITFCTRWHSEDVIGLIRKDMEENEDPDYVMPELITFSAQKELEDIGNEYDIRPVGGYLWDIYKAKYADAKKDPIVWSCVMQQKPINLKGLMLDAEDLINWTTKPLLNNVWISIDTNMKADTEQGDKTSVQVWQLSFPNKYLIDVYYVRTNFIDLVNQVNAILEKYNNYSAILIETRANGQALIDVLKTKFSRVIGVDPASLSKADRLQMCLPEFKAHNVFLPPYGECPNGMEVRKQLLNFTGAKGRTDDHVDACTMFLNYTRNNIIRRPENSFTVKQIKNYDNIISQVIDIDDPYINNLGYNHGSNTSGLPSFN